MITRFGNVVGKRGTHGAILDFCRKLRNNPDELEVLGDGEQAKPYLHVQDCAAGLLFALDNGQGYAGAPGVWNLAPPDTTTVARIAELCVAASPNARARIRYTGGSKGWRGDVPTSRIVPEKLAKLGFRVRHTSDGGRASRGRRDRARGLAVMRGPELTYPEPMHDRCAGCHVAAAAEAEEVDALTIAFGILLMVRDSDYETVIAGLCFLHRREFKDAMNGRGLNHRSTKMNKGPLPSPAVLSVGWRLLEQLVANDDPAHSLVGQRIVDPTKYVLTMNAAHALVRARDTLRPGWHS